MRHPGWLNLVVALGGTLFGTTFAGTIKYEVLPLGGSSYQYTYDLNGFTFQANEQLDIRFNPTLFASLWNASAPAGFDIQLLQPNNPPGDYGDYSALATMNNLSGSGSFTVDVSYFGAGLPGPQPFFINQFDADGFYLATTDAGMTMDANAGITTDAPEPSSLCLVSALALFGAAWQIRRCKLSVPRQP
jgi:hypothetical protein